MRGKKENGGLFKTGFDRLDAKYETFRDDFEAEYFLQKNALGDDQAAT